MHVPDARIRHCLSRGRVASIPPREDEVRGGQFVHPTLTGRPTTLPEASGWGFSRSFLITCRSGVLVFRPGFERAEGKDLLASRLHCSAVATRLESVSVGAGREDLARDS